MSSYPQSPFDGESKFGFYGDQRVFDSREPLGGTPDNPDLPLYGATMGQAIGRFFMRYFKFYGRSSRSEYWWWQLFVVLLGVSFGVIEILWGGAGDSANVVDWQLTAAGNLFGTATFIPTLTLTVRRLHDMNRSGLFILFFLLPLLGAVVLMIMCIFPSNPLGRRHDDPQAWGVRRYAALRNGQVFRP